MALTFGLSIWTVPEVLSECRNSRADKASSFDELLGQGYLEAYRSINETFLIALDGSDIFSSENGQTFNRHIAATPKRLVPG